tara:strand:- start:1109 stop:1669 length:561 start_codon:yes stop_codon:yes gene_type:complete
MTDSTTDFDLMFLTNNSDIRKVRNKKLEPEFRVDLEFYKERIKKHTLELLDGSTIESQIDSSFKRYLYLMIQHLKFIDKRDIIQKDYAEIKVKQKKQRPFNLKKTNTLMEKKKEKVGKITDNIDIKIKYKKTRKMIMPQKKVINLKDEALKTKGLEKKECVDNIVENAIKKDKKKKKKKKEEKTYT